MGYLGNHPVQGNFAVIDDISSQFNGSTTQFTIQVGSNTQTIGSLAQMFIHINGVYQIPGTAFTAGFTGAPASGATFSGQIFGDTLDIGAPSDATITAAKLTSIQGAYRNVQTLTGGLSITSTENASIVGPITVSSGQTINVASGGTLVIL
mgnify:CR=1 FL=1